MGKGNIKIVPENSKIFPRFFPPNNTNFLPKNSKSFPKYKKKFTLILFSNNTQPASKDTILSPYYQNQP